MQICEICLNANGGDNWVVVLKDDKKSFELNGHKDCIDKIHNKIKKIKDIDKLPVDKILKEIGFTKDGNE